jgi:hypothetical protein
MIWDATDCVVHIDAEGRMTVSAHFAQTVACTFAMYGPAVTHTIVVGPETINNTSPDAFIVLRNALVRASSEASIPDTADESKVSLGLVKTRETHMSAGDFCIAVENACRVMASGVAGHTHITVSASAEAPLPEHAFKQHVSDVAKNTKTAAVVLGVRGDGVGRAIQDGWARREFASTLAVFLGESAQVIDDPTAAPVTLRDGEFLTPAQFPR